jgi:hypothetical protein
MSYPVLLADNVWSPGCRYYGVFYTYSFDGNPVSGRLHRDKPSDCVFIVPGTLEEAPEHDHEYWPQALARARKGH